MADQEYQSTGICSSSTGNWWNSSGISNNNSRSGLTSTSSPGSTNNTQITTDININNINGSSSSSTSYGWCNSNNHDHHQMMAEMMKTRSSCVEQASSSVSVSGSSSIVNYQSSDNHTQRPLDQASGSDSIGGGHLEAAAAGSVLMDSNLQMMGFDLSSSPTTDWTQTLLRSSSGRAETNFHSMLQESRLESDIGHHHHHEDSSSIHAFKQMNQVFSLDDPQSFNSNKNSEDCIVTCQGLPMNFSMNSSATTNYDCAPSSSSLLHGLYHEPGDQQSSHENRINYSSSSTNYCMNNSNELISPSWSSKFPQFLKSNAAPTKEQPSININQLHFSNDAPFWNASSNALMTDIHSNFFSSPRSQFLTPNLEDQKPNCSNLSLKANIEVLRESGSQVKKSSNEPAFKRPRIETPSTMPTFKVRKEKLGDRITALQQLCSPFGKTDTASVLYEAIEYIKFLHEQVSILSNPYMKNGAPTQYQQNLDKSKDVVEGLRQDLRSRGLCLVPISSTFTVTNETTTDFWTPTFGGTYR